MHSSATADISKCRILPLLESSSGLSCLDSRWDTAAGQRERKQKERIQMKSAEQEAGRQQAGKLKEEVRCCTCRF